MPTRLIFVGGFLGAGKTTLLWEAAQRLASRGLRAGLITNDQAAELVDTALLSRGGIRVAEVNGSCFCCNFQGLLDAVSDVRDAAKPDVIIAEPVGSCTDLSATIIQPLKDQLQRDLTTAPLSVLADPLRLADILAGGSAGLHPSAAYIFRKQLEEADLIVISKIDLLTEAQLHELRTHASMVYPNARTIAVSSISGVGLDEWLDAVTTRSDAGKHVVAVDYDRYAEGEAVLGWLNATVSLRGEPTDWRAFATGLLTGLGQEFDQRGASVGHVKILLESGGEFLVGNLTGKSETLSIRGHSITGPEARLIINARVEMSPDKLDQLVREALAATNRDIAVTVLAWRCLSPGRPRPSYRYDRVVVATA